MAEDVLTVTGDFNGVSTVDILTGPASGRYEVVSIDVHNADDATHDVTLYTYIGAQRRFRLQNMPPGVSYTWEGKLVLKSGHKLQGVLAAADSPHVVWAITYRSVS